MDIRTEFAKRLRKARNDLNMTVPQVSALMPSHPEAPRFSHWEKGARLPKMEQILELAEALRVSPSYLCGFSSEMQDADARERRVLIPEDAPLSLPTGDVVMIPSDHSLQFRLDDILAQGLTPERQILLAVNDTSMHPVLSEGDRVLVDRDCRVPETRDIFALLVRNKVWFRWICPELDGTFTVTAEDGEQQRETRIEADELETLCIIGRVAHIARYR